MCSYYFVRSFMAIEVNFSQLCCSELVLYMTVSCVFPGAFEFITSKCKCMSCSPHWFSVKTCGSIILTFYYLQLLSTEASSVLIKKENSRIKRYRKEAGEDCKNGEVSRIHNREHWILLIACCIELQDIAFMMMLTRIFEHILFWGTQVFEHLFFNLFEAVTAQVSNDLIKAIRTINTKLLIMTFVPIISVLISIRYEI